MPGVISSPPVSSREPVMETYHGVPITDPYRWLEEPHSARTRRWIGQQVRYARAHLDGIPGRESIRSRIREFLEVETYDSVQKTGNRYFFRKRLAAQEQPCLYVREGTDGDDQLLIDPSKLGRGKHTAVKLVRASPRGRLLLYQIKEGGERSGTFALLDLETRKTLPDVFPRGYLSGFAFAPDEKSVYYVHDRLDSPKPIHRALHHHILGSKFESDREIFCAGDGDNIRLGIVSDGEHLGILVHRLLDGIRTDFYIKRFETESRPTIVFADVGHTIAPQLIAGRIFAITNRDAPNFRIVELRVRENSEPEWVDVVSEGELQIHQWRIAGERIHVSYVQAASSRISIFNLDGQAVGEIPIPEGRTTRFIAGPSEGDELFLEQESFTEPVSILRYSPALGGVTPWATKTIPFDRQSFGHSQIWFDSKDGTRIPMLLFGRKDVLAGGSHPTIMTSYGGYGVSMTPQFSGFVACLVEQGCLFALPNIRGGSEFGAAWHQAAKRRKRQNAYDDFLSAAEWLIETGRTTAGKLAIFGGSNSGLLAGAAMTQRPDLFRAVILMVPILDMLRYHLFDGARIWQDEFGTAEDPEDFAALLQYSPYHKVQDGTEYPATLIVSGDADQNCNPLHARKMTARLQCANVSDRPILLDYSEFRGHSPVLPLTDRIEALTDRIAFLTSQLQLPCPGEGVSPCGSS